MDNTEEVPLATANLNENTRIQKPLVMNLDSSSDTINEFNATKTFTKEKIEK